jgi:hypothetical protein
LKYSPLVREKAWWICARMLGHQFWLRVSRCFMSYLTLGWSYLHLFTIMLNAMVICKCGHLHSYLPTSCGTIPIYYVGLFCQSLLIASVCHNSCLAVVMSFWKRHRNPDAGFSCGCIALIFDWGVFSC